MKSPFSLRSTIVSAAVACLLAVGSAASMNLFKARGAESTRLVQSFEVRGATNTFGPSGEFKSEDYPVRIFVVKKDDSDGVIEDFNAAKNDKLRLEGFGLTKPQTVKALMQQDGKDTVLALTGGPSIRFTNTPLESITAGSLQLELDRDGLIQTFADDFDHFSWYSQGMSPQKDHRGTWDTVPEPRATPGESEIYADPAFTGTSPQPLGLNPFHLTNGTLEIWGEKAPERVLPFIWGRRYVSGLIMTKYGFSQLYGVFEIRARLPKGRGFWPAFWLLPADRSWPPEIDVFEVLGHETTKLYATAHTNEGGTHRAMGTDMLVPDLSADFHRYAVEWKADEIRWYFDGVEIARVATPSDMHKPMYLLANLAIGAGWPGQPDNTTQFPGVFAIDWIRAYRREP